MLQRENCWCVYTDPYGLVCLFIVYLQIFYVNYCTLFLVVYPIFGISGMGIVLASILCFFTIMILWSGFMASHTEPGLVVNKKYISEEAKHFYITSDKNGYCQKCDCLKPVRAHHCSKCNQCILKMDHHCPWINNCVGARNQKYFILYLIYVHLGEAFACLLGFIQIYLQRGILQRGIHFHYLKDYSSQLKFLPTWFLTHLKIPIVSWNVIPCVFLIIEVFFSLLVVVFTLSLLYDQVNALRYDLTYVEYLKHYHMHVMEDCLYDCLVSCMGEPLCWRWLIPVEGKYMRQILRKLSSEYLCINEHGSFCANQAPQEDKKTQ